jgi:hypothetical protein
MSIFSFHSSSDNGSEKKVDEKNAPDRLSKKGAVTSHRSMLHAVWHFVESSPEAVA